MQRFKYSGNAISATKKIVLLKQETRVIMIDRNKAVSGLFNLRPFLLNAPTASGLMLTYPSLRYMYFKLIAIV